MDPSVLPLYSFVFTTTPYPVSSFAPFPFLVLEHRSQPYFRQIQPPYAPQALQTSVPVPPPPPTSTFVPRQKSRFDRPANPPQNISRPRDHDVYVHADATPQRDREHELTFAQINAEGATKRVDHDRPSDAIAGARILQPASPPEKSLSASPLASQMEQSRTYPNPRLVSFSPKSSCLRAYYLQTNRKDTDTLCHPKAPGSMIPSSRPRSRGHRYLRAKHLLVRGTVV